MAKKYKSFTAFADDLKAELTKAMRTRILNDLAILARQVIYNRVKSGFGVNPTTLTRQRLKRLSRRYIDYRTGNFQHTRKIRGKSIVKNRGAVKLGAFGTPSKSNLTLTGEMLENIEIKFRGSGVTLYFPDIPHPVHKHVTIAKLAQYVEEQGRPFFYLTQDERQILVADFEVAIRRAVGSL